MQANVVGNLRYRCDAFDIGVEAWIFRREPLPVEGLVPVAQDVEGVEVGDGQPRADDEVPVRAIRVEVALEGVEIVVVTVAQHPPNAVAEEGIETCGHDVIGMLTRAFT